MPDVFISYSRRDKNFVQQLNDELLKAGLDTWVDWDDIPLTADWWREIQEGIDASNAFLFVISPDSAKSDVCLKEIQHAEAARKRMVPLMYRSLDAGQRAADVIQAHNWIFFNDPAQFTGRINDLIVALNTDLAHTREHTRLLLRAREWDQHNRDASRLLSGKEIDDAEQWLTAATSADKSPAPNELQTSYIFASRAHQRQIARRLLGGVSVGLVIVAILAILSFFLFRQSEANLALANVLGTQEAEQRATAVSAESTAVRSAAEAGSLALAAGARAAITADDSDLAMALAMAAIELDSPPGEVESTLQFVAYSPGARYVLTSPEDYFFSATAFSRDGQKFLAGTSPLPFLGANFTNEIIVELMLYDTETGSELQRTRLNGAQITAIVNHPLDNTVFIADGGDIVHWDVDQWTEISRFPGSILLNRLDVSSDGQQIASGDSRGNIHILDTSTGEVLFQERPFSGSVLSVALHPQKTILAAGHENGILTIYQNGTLLHEIIAYPDQDESSVYSVLFNESGDRLYTISGGGLIKVWDILSGQVIETYPEGTQSAFEAVFSPEGQILYTGSGNGQIDGWNITRRADTRTYLGHTSITSSIAVSPDGLLLLTSALDGQLRLWFAGSGAEQSRFSLDASGMRRFAVNPTNADELFVGTTEGTVIQFNQNTGAIIQRFNVGADAVTGIAANGERLTALTFDGQMRMWNIETGAEIWSTQFNDLGSNVVWTEDGSRLVVALLNATSSSVLVLNPQTGNQLNELNLTPDELLPLELTLIDNNTIAVGVLGPQVTGRASFFDLESGERIFTYQQDRGGHTDAVYSVAVSDTLVATGDGKGQIILWDRATGEFHRRLLGHTDIVRDLAFTPDGRFLISAGQDATIRLWDTTSWSNALLYEGHTQRIYDVILSSDNALLYSASLDGTVRSWTVPVNIDQVAEWARANRFIRPLTCSEQLQYGLSGEDCE